MTARYQRPPPRYAAVGGDQEIHPIDKIVESLVPHETERRRIVQLHQEIQDALGDEATLLLELDSIAQEMRYEREALYYDLGYHQGHLLGQVEILTGHDGGVPHLCEIFIRAALLVPPRSAVSALLLVAVAVMRGDGAGQ